MISQRALDLVIASEVGSRRQYEQKYQRPEWPGGQSGVTIGIGYDLGYSNAVKLHADFDDLLPVAMIKVMERCLGVRGDAARNLLSSVRGLVSVPWDVAIKVFMECDVPKYMNEVKAHIPGVDSLSPDCQGVLFSLAYNRGASFDSQGSRYIEMRMIKVHIISGNLPAVAQDIRDMKRLWVGQGLDGLLARRDAEAKIWLAGLYNPASAAGTLTVSDAPKNELINRAPNGAVAGATTGAATTAAMAVQGAHWGWIILGIVVTVAVFFAIRQIAAGAAIARQKDTP